MADFPRYEPAGVRCSGVAQPGVVAFMEWAIRDFGRGAFNLGIYNCRSVRGSANRSVHGDGRAGDVGFPGVNRQPFDEARLLSGTCGGIRVHSIYVPNGRELD